MICIEIKQKLSNLDLFTFITTLIPLFILENLAKPSTPLTRALFAFYHTHSITILTTFKIIISGGAKNLNNSHETQLLHVEHGMTLVNLSTVSY